MSTKLNNVQISPEFESLFSMKDRDEKVEHHAQMISYRILSEIEKVCEQKKIKKKDLAHMVDASRSYITQLFRGTKFVNTTIMAKFEEALNISFDFKVKLNEESHDEFLGKQLTIGIRNHKRFQANGYVWFCFEDKKNRDATDELVSRMSTENEKLQKAG